MVSWALIGRGGGGHGMIVAAVMVGLFNGEPCNVGNLEHRLGHLDASHDSIFEIWVFRLGESSVLRVPLGFRFSHGMANCRRFRLVVVR